MANAPNPGPATSSQLIPMLVCRNVGAELEFRRTVFDAVEVSRRPGADGAIVHALIRIGEAMVIIEGEWPTLTSREPQGDGSSPVVIFVNRCGRGHRASGRRGCNDTGVPANPALG